MINYILGAILLAIVALASYYIYKQKKSGKGCIGCPHSGSCSGCCSKKQ